MPMPTPPARRRAGERSGTLPLPFAATHELVPGSTGSAAGSDILLAAALTAEANSLYAISLHAITSAEWWVLSCVGEESLERDRDAEFAAVPSWASCGRASRVPGRGGSAARRMTRELAAMSRHPAGNRMNRRCLTHTIEHLGLHLGHIEITIDWWKATQG